MHALYEQPACGYWGNPPSVIVHRFQASSGECCFASRYKEKTMRKIGLILTAVIALAAGGTLRDSRSGGASRRA